MDAAGGLGVLGEPTLLEPSIVFESGDAVLGTDDLAIEVLARRLCVGGPVACGTGLAPHSRMGDAPPAVPLASPAIGQVNPALGVLVLAAGLVELAGGTADGGVLPAAGPACEIVSVLAESV
ncbi:MAG TPA: hypothetical protein VFG94_06085, partial [Acidimicrobiales bacterium]|nr:hypothetical protein [Acidimicrobiales bacterium]